VPAPSCEGTERTICAARRAFCPCPGDDVALSARSRRGHLTAPSRGAHQTDHEQASLGGVTADLDELAHRHPEGFRRWLDDGARATCDPFRNVGHRSGPAEPA
jgi:hypothetical protein